MLQPPTGLNLCAVEPPMGALHYCTKKYQHTYNNSYIYMSYVFTCVVGL